MHKSTDIKLSSKHSDAVKLLDKTHDIEETIHKVDINQDTSKAKLHFEAEGDPKSIVVTPPGPRVGNEVFNKEWVLKQIKLAVGDAVTTLRDESQQMEKRIEQKFDAKIDGLRSEMNQKFEQTNKRIENVEKQNKETNENLN
ncbi:hypothetical protein [Mycoplasmopsis agassizii]|nr:hypothetical protein [Mycoplasmopsis agassizii]